MRPVLIGVTATLSGLLLVANAPAQVSFSILSSPEGRQIRSVTVSRNGDWIGASSVLGTREPVLHRYATTGLVREDLEGWEGTDYFLSRSGISDDGRTMAFMLRRSGNGEVRTWGYRWRDGSYWMVRDIFGFTNTGTLVSHMSANGNHIFGAGPNFFNEFEAWRASDGRQGKDIVTGPVGGAGPTPPSCSAAGTTAIWSENSGTTSYLWSSTSGVQTIRNGVRWQAMSASGAVLAGVGSSRTLYTWDHAAGQPISRGSIQGLGSLIPYRVAAEGDLVLLQNYTDYWIWTELTGSIALRDYIQSFGVDPTGWSSFFPVDVSDDGRVFTGMGQFNGVQTPFVFVIPASPTGLAFGVIAVVAGVRRRRRREPEHR